MKKIFLAVIIISLLTSSFNNVYGQEAGKDKDTEKSDLKPRTKVEALMPPIGPGEMSVVLMGPAIDEQEKRMHDYFSSPMYDYFLQAYNVFQVIPELVNITRKTGKKIKYLILAGHGDPSSSMPGFGITTSRASGMARRPVISAEAFGPDQINVGQWEMDYKRLDKKRNIELAKWAEDHSGKNAPEEKRKFEATEKELSDTFKNLSDIHDLTGIMAQDGVIIMFNCFSGIEGHREFSRDLARILFGVNGGKVLVHNTMIRVGKVPMGSDQDTAANKAFEVFAKFLGRVEEGYWRRGGEVFAWTSFTEIPIEPVEYKATPSVIYVSLKDPLLIVNEGSAVEIEPTVKGVGDSGMFKYDWYGACVGKIGSKCKLDIYDEAGKLLGGKVVVTDEKGRKGEATFYIYIQTILADIKLSEKTPAAGSMVGASAVITQGKRPAAETYWEWKASGGLLLQEKYGDSVKVKANSAGELKARLLSDDVLLGKGRVLAEASVEIKPKGRAVEEPAAEESKGKEPEKAAGKEGAPERVTVGDQIQASPEELDGDWVTTEGSVYDGSGLRFSHSGDSYIGTLINVTKAWNGGPLQGLAAGDMVFRLKRVSAHIYKGGERKNWDGNTTWDDVYIAVQGNELQYNGGYGEEELDGSGVTLGKRLSAISSPSAAPSAPPAEASSTTVGRIVIHVEKTSPATNTIAVGEKAQFKAIAMSATGEAVRGINFRWQPYPEVEFEPFEKSATTTATFRRPGEYKIYVQALRKDGARYVTAGESDEAVITVTNSSWRLSFMPQEPLVGQEVKARINPDIGKNAAEIDVKEMNFRWQVPANARQTGTSEDDREITFYLTDSKPAAISCLASTKYNNDNLGGAGKTVKAKSYDLIIGGPSPRQEFQEWKGGTQLGEGPSGGMKKVANQFAVDQEIFFSSKITPVPPRPVSYNWTASPEDCTFNSNGGSSTSITCRSTDSYTVKVTAKMDGMEIGSAATGVSVTMSQGGSAGSKNIKEEKAQQFVNEGYGLEKQGRLVEAVEKYESAVKMIPDPKLMEHIAALEKKIAELRKGR